MDTGEATARDGGTAVTGYRGSAPWPADSVQVTHTGPATASGRGVANTGILAIHFHDEPRFVSARWTFMWLGLSALAVAAGCLAVVVWARSPATQREPSVLAIAALLLVLGGALATTTVARHRQSQTLWGNRSRWYLDAAAERLADALGEQWGREERLRRLQDPVPVPVRWSNALPRLADHWSNIGNADGPVDLSGGLDDIEAVFERVPSGRLVVLGKAGAGKSVLMLRFVLGQLDRRQPGDRVPVILPLASWRPEAQPDLWEWAADRLGADHASLATGVVSARAVAKELLRTGRVFPVLDGFDEIPAGARPEALRKLNATLDAAARILLTSRDEEYRDAL
ncbi:NACHT domain-containing protein [Streptomyces sp. NPDC048506]|uniref:NACHT domain-containing protein n=1 Tax=Streptomyces sp. NPDC048506 TaxID=3155028 RepID=UPI003417AAFD